jgi:hypothetical protein
MSDVLTITGTSPAEAATAIIGAPISGLGKYRGFRIEALLVGATGGALDIYIQRKVAPNLWTDWMHFTQLAAGAAAVRYALTCDHTNSTTVATTTNGGTDTVPALALAAGTFIGGHPGDSIRVVAVAGASTSAGAAVAIHFQGIAP